MAINIGAWNREGRVVSEQDENWGFTWLQGGCELPVGYECGENMSFYHVLKHFYQMLTFNIIIQKFSENTVHAWQSLNWK